MVHPCNPALNENKTMYKQIWQTLSKIDCTPHVEKKNGLSYLSWAWAWGVLMEHYPDAQYSFDPPQVFPNGTQMVFCTVQIGECSRRMWLPVMDHRNKSIVDPDSFSVNTSMMRCLVKCLALYGLGHYIYAGEDLPAVEIAPVTESQVQELVALIETLGDRINLEAFLGFFKIGGLAEMKSSDFAKAKALLEKKVKQ
jgi:hypothetical protein